MATLPAPTCATPPGFALRPPPFVYLLAPLWANNTRIQLAANNQPSMRSGEGDRIAVGLLQQALVQSGFPIGADTNGAFGIGTANAIINVERRFGFPVDSGEAGRDVLGVLDLSLRGWNPTSTALWGAGLAATITPLALRKIDAALSALEGFSTMLRVGGFDFTIADGVTMAAARTHFKLVPPGGNSLPNIGFISIATIDPLLRNFRDIRKVLSNANMLRNSICSNGLCIAAEAPFGGPMRFGPAFSDLQLAPAGVTNIDRTGPNSLAAMLMHEATHVVDRVSGDAAIHISEFALEYETQTFQDARHNPSAYATFAAHLFAGSDRPRSDRFGLGDGRRL